MEQPGITVIIPVYNVEPFLQKCIDSILAQTYHEFEVLLINDGSNDNSGKICDYNESNDTRIKVFHKKNEGVSIARNLGLKHASGKYVTFIDSDDWIDKKYLETLWKNSTGSDLIISGYHTQNKNLRLEAYLPKKETFLNGQFKSLYEDYIRTAIIKAPWCKLFSSEIIKKNKLQFNTEMTLGEDTIFTFGFLSVAKNISVIDYSGYYWRYNSSSLSRVVDSDRWSLFLDNFTFEYDKLIERYGNSRVLNKWWADRCLHVLTRKIKEVYKNQSYSKVERIAYIEKEYNRMRQFSFDYWKGGLGNYSKMVAIIYHLSKDINKFDQKIRVFTRLLSFFNKSDFFNKANAEK